MKAHPQGVRASRAASITAQTLDMATSILGVSLAFVFERGEQQHKNGGKLSVKRKKRKNKKKKKEKLRVKVGAWLLCFAFPPEEQNVLPAS